MQINNILQSFQSNLVPKKELRTKDKPADNVTNKDMVSISSEARDLQKASQAGRTEQTAPAPPEARADKIEAARTRLAEGYYSTPQVIAKVADNLLKQFNI
jgi:anti-sigma28 factor (negative regulator of flagellin synthesis)